MSVQGSDNFTSGSRGSGTPGAWNLASDGQSWAQGAGTDVTSFTGTQGQISGGANLNVFFLGTKTLADIDVVCRLTNVQTTDSLGVVGRATAGATHYDAFFANGNFHLSKDIAGTVTDLATAVAITEVAGGSSWVRLRCQGSTISGKYWQDGNAEPNTWTIQVTGETSITAAGQFGVRGKPNNSTNAIGFDSFTASDPAILKILAGRFNLLAQMQTRAFASRFRLMSQPRSRKFSGRLLLLAVSQPFLSSRFLLKSQPKSKRLSARLILATGHQYLLPGRFLLAGPPSIAALSPPSGQPSTNYRGEGTLPVQPFGFYAVNGVILDAQPVVCTAPSTLAGNTVLAGSSFTLLFSSPSIYTMGVLQDGSTVIMTFAIPGGMMVTGQVLLAATLASSSSTVTNWALRAFGPAVKLSVVTTGTNVYVVEATVMNPITFTTNVILTPFF